MHTWRQVKPPDDEGEETGTPNIRRSGVRIPCLQTRQKSSPWRRVSAGEIFAPLSEADATWASPRCALAVPGARHNFDDRDEREVIEDSHMMTWIQAMSKWYRTEKHDLPMAASAERPTPRMAARKVG